MILPDYRGPKLMQAMPEEARRAWLGSLSSEQLEAISKSWEWQAMPHQRLPEGDWRVWVMLAGRFTGKTFGASKTVNWVAKDPEKIGNGEIGIIGRNYRESRRTMVEGPSGILATASPDFMPEWEPGKGKLTWPNGVVGYTFSADNADKLRGNNWSFVWADELCFWPNAESVWNEAVELALRRGWARAMVSSSPIPTKFIKELLNRKSTVTTHASTYSNYHADPKVLKTFSDLYKGTRRERQELHGELIEDVDGALWSHSLIEASRESFSLEEDSIEEIIESLGIVRIAVGVDPSTTSGETSDETGIVVAGCTASGKAYVLQDASLRAKPEEWAAKVAAVYRLWNAHVIVVERNQGGEMIESLLRQYGKNQNIKTVHAKVGKTLRAEPVASLYSRGKVKHCGTFPALELQQTEWTQGSSKSPDRLDALVYALTELMLDKQNEKKAGPISAYFPVPKGNKR